VRRWYGRLIRYRARGRVNENRMGFLKKNTLPKRPLLPQEEEGAERKGKASFRWGVKFGTRKAARKTGQVLFSKEA